jgi:hypothetical protein
MIGRLSHFIKHQNNQSLNRRQNLSELRAICTIAEEWGETTSQPHGFILLHQNVTECQNKALKQVITKGPNPEYSEIHEHQDTTVNETFTLYHSFVISRL